ncbi:AAA family ATPase [Snodgrassella communis]|uniref:Protease, ATP-binding subunit n=1 Tax=Snodgrassella communis TaxID=2946699 RepID=A0A066TLI5_9NEIS|nr:ATP-binding protein [Snodgrassella communis]KDN12774.1 protease, ATP-binding subunit [Snodgrassella communis]KDN15084.1 protease, ATP-binding subunit [Snodgrassella communis]PIT10202.1 AAA family ATPase [Snodgrassella communis]PIT29864.1 AAA family ATPase [Snodgrassella communis]PIT30244.1 AAA family ATPase [Snodgrassella communis]
MKRNELIQLATTVLQRLDAILPPLAQEPDWTAVAYRWHKLGNKGILESLPHPHTFALNCLAAVDEQRRQLVRNTEQFLAGRPANNVLMTGARGTGKSSLVKALLHQYAAQGLRLVEVDKGDLLTLPALLTMLALRPEKFILFCDDLSFEDGDDAYKALKTTLDGGLSQRCDNVLVYATSNRRHLMPEYMADNTAQTGSGGEVHPQEAVEEKVSLSDRFGLWLSFYPFDQDAYLQAVENWLEQVGLHLDDTTKRAALNWSQSRGSRSGRVAWQFVCDWVGREPQERKV